MSDKNDQLIANLSAVGFALPEIEAYLIRRKKKPEDPLNVYETRRRGEEYCQTDGSDHYMLPGVEPMDLIISLGYAEHFCLASIIKYAARYGETGNPEDLKKIADYAHILCGVQLAEGEAP